MSVAGHAKFIATVKRAVDFALREWDVSSSQMDIVYKFNSIRFGLDGSSHEITEEWNLRKVGGRTITIRTPKSQWLVDVHGNIISCMEKGDKTLSLFGQKRIKVLTLIKNNHGIEQRTLLKKEGVREIYLTEMITAGHLKKVPLDNYTLATHNLPHFYYALTERGEYMLDKSINSLDNNKP